MNDTEPQGVVAMLGDAGPAPTVTHKNKTWTIGHPTQRAKAELEIESLHQKLDLLSEDHVHDDAGAMSSRDGHDPGGHVFFVAADDVVGAAGEQRGLPSGSCG